MLTIPPPVSNIERQRQFRARNPGYFRRYRANRRAAMEALAAQTLSAPVVPQQLALPAPVEPILIPGMNAIPTMADPLVTTADVPINR